MKTVLTIFSVLVILFSFAQDINPVLYQKTWLDKETRYIYNYAVTKEFGQMPHAPSAYNSLPITSIAYKGLNELKEGLKEEARKQDWSNAELNSSILELEQTAQGGILEIYISRYQEQKANFRWFFVIIRDKNDKEKLLEKELEYQAPEVPFERGYWNYKTMKIPIELETPFYIYLNDKESPWLSDFKFLVEDMPEGIEQAAE